MKMFIASALAFFAASSAQAFFPVEAQVSLTPQQVTLTVANIWSAPIACQGQFFAQTYSAPEGIWIPFAMGPIVAGTFGYEYMNPPYVYEGDYFIAVPSVSVFCDYAF